MVNYNKSPLSNLLMDGVSRQSLSYSVVNESNKLRSGEQYLGQISKIISLYCVHDAAGC